MISAVQSVTSGRSSSALRQAIDAEPKLNRAVITVAWDKLKAAKAYNKAHPELTPQQKNDNLSNAQAEAGKEPDFIDWLLSGNRLQVMETLSRDSPLQPVDGIPRPAELRLAPQAAQGLLLARLPR